MAITAIPTPTHHKEKKVLVFEPLICCFLTTIPGMSGGMFPHGGCAYVVVHKSHPGYNRLKRLVKAKGSDYGVGYALNAEAEVTLNEIEGDTIRIGIDNAHSYVRTPVEFEAEAMDLLAKIRAYMAIEDKKVELDMLGAKWSLDPTKHGCDIFKDGIYVDTVHGGEATNEHWIGVALKMILEMP